MNAAIEKFRWLQTAESLLLAEVGAGSADLDEAIELATGVVQAVAWQRDVARSRRSRPDRPDLSRLYRKQDRSAESLRHYCLKLSAPEVLASGLLLPSSLVLTLGQ